jgi:hypothetical protein
MNLQRFTEILEAYGGDPNHWPEDERESALAFKSTNPQAMALVEETIALDQLLESLVVPESDHAKLAREIQLQVANTSSPVDKFIRWLFPERRSLLRPAAVACLPVILGIMIGYQESSSDELSLEEELALLAVTYQVDDFEGVKNEQ